jgi:hypothetical protein
LIPGVALAVIRLGVEGGVWLVLASVVGAVALVCLLFLGAARLAVREKGGDLVVLANRRNGTSGATRGRLTVQHEVLSWRPAIDGPSINEWRWSDIRCFRIRRRRYVTLTYCDVTLEATDGRTTTLVVFMDGVRIESLLKEHKIAPCRSR